MADIYQRFLQAPSASLLSSNASIHYITTTTSIHQPEAIIKHIQAQEKQVEKKAEKVLSIVESSNGVCLETETTLKFVRGGGVILPQMDDNMLADMTVTLPIIHVVELDAGKISQIRLYWDQGTMLKQVEAIGKSGRNWPIRDGKDQVKLISQSAANQRTTAGATNSAGSRATPKDDFNTRLFATGVDGDGRSAAPKPQVSARESSKPQPRQWDELFSGENDGHHRSITSPGLKAGAGKNFSSNRLFDDSAPSESERSPERRKQDPSKFQHFDFDDDVNAAPHNGAQSFRRKNEQGSKYEIQDFSTPEKNTQRSNPEQELHIGYGIDEEDPPSMPRRNVVHLPRPDAKPHFQITDERSPAASKEPLHTITNVNAARRQEEIDSHFPATEKALKASENTDPKNGYKPNKPRSDMTSTWNFADMQESPVQAKKIYKTAGDGMGGRAGTRFWDVAGDDAPSQYGGKGGEKQVYKTAGNGMGGKKGTGLSWSIGEDD